MIYRKLDNDGDYSFGRGKQDFVSDVNAVAQAIKTRLLLLVGEWWEDQADGTPMFQSILGIPGSDENIESADLIIKDRILDTPYVTEIITYSSNYEKRHLDVKYTVNTSFGSTVTDTITA
jgi:hypothetical protein